jgi:protein TonB
VNRKEPPEAFLASVLIHLMVLVVAARWLGRPRPVPEPEPEAPPPVTLARMTLPPPAAWRPPAPPVQPRPAQARNAPERPEPRPDAKDRVSIGGPSTIRQKTPLELRRDEDLTRTIARGRPDAPGGPESPSPARTPGPARQTPAPPADVRVASRDLGSAPERPPVRDLVDAPLAPSPRPVGSPRPAGGSIAESLRNLDERLAAESARGLSSGTVQQMGTSPLLFDPQGADFTAWTNHFKNEVYRNWIVPPSVSLGIRGQVEIEFVIERDGTMSSVRLLRSSGTPALDRAARNALLGSRLLPLPSDYRPDQVTIQVTFFYNERGARP